MSDRDSSGRFLPGGVNWRPAMPFRQREYLIREYVEAERSTGEIAGEFGVTDAAILFWLKHHDIRRRTVGGARAIKHWGSSGPANPMFGRRGPLNGRYIDGSSPERQRLYSRGEGHTFLLAIYARDSYKCRRCGVGKVGPRSLHAHHLAPWAGHPSLRFDPENVVLLCRPCHYWVHGLSNTEREWLA